MGLLEVLLLAVNIYNLVSQIQHCNNMNQRYTDIINLSILSCLELAVGLFFIFTVKNNRSNTWLKTKIETIAIIVGVIASFGFKIVIKATHLSRSGSGKFGKDSAISYHTQSFLQFVLSEFLLIAVWTWFKAPDDVFSTYNNLPIKKFSIF